jgi:hypothetical protein
MHPVGPCFDVLDNDTFAAENFCSGIVIGLAFAVASNWSS